MVLPKEMQSKRHHTIYIPHYTHNTGHPHDFSTSTCPFLGRGTTGTDVNAIFTKFKEQRKTRMTNYTPESLDSSSFPPKTKGRRSSAIFSCLFVRDFPGIPEERHHLRSAPITGQCVSVNLQKSRIALDFPHFCVFAWTFVAEQR